MKNSLKYFIPKVLYGLALIFTGFMFFRGTTIGRVFVEIGKELELYLIIATTFLIIMSCFTAYYEYHGFGSQEGVFRRGPNKPFVCLTFDDGPSPKCTPQILDVLKEKGVKASFFVTGKHVESHPEIARRIVAEGHDIGNHTYNHKELTIFNRKTILDELSQADEVIQRTTGIKSNLFRPPRGICGNVARELLIEEGYRVILWTVSALDWRKVKPKTILWRVKLFAKNGAIILFHDNGSLFGCKMGNRTNTVKALPQVIDFLEAEGYELITVSEMLKCLEESKQEDAVCRNMTQA